MQSTIQRLCPGAVALYAVIAHAQVDDRQIPALALAVGLQLQTSVLTAQAPGEVEARVGLQLLVTQGTLALQRTAEIARQFGQPVRRIELAQRQVGFPVDARGEADAQRTRRTALPGLQLQLRQMHRFEIAADRAVQCEIPGRAGHDRFEIAEIAAVVVLNLRLELAQRHRRLFDRRVEPSPGKIAPEQIGIRGQAVLPVDIATQPHIALLPRIQLEHLDLRSARTDDALQRQPHCAALARQFGGTEQPVAVLQVAARCQLQIVQTQGVWQIGQRLEPVGVQPERRRQLLIEGPQLPAEGAVEIALALHLHLQLLAQGAIHGDHQRPRLFVRRLQRGLPVQRQRPITAGLQSASH